MRGEFLNWRLADGLLKLAREIASVREEAGGSCRPAGCEAGQDEYWQGCCTMQESVARSVWMFLVVFAVGVSLGFAWKRGWIPVEISAPHAGYLESPEPLPPPNTQRSRSAAPESAESASSPEILQTNLVEPARIDPAIFERQEEPPVVEGETVTRSPQRLSENQSAEAIPLPAPGAEPKPLSPSLLLPEENRIPANPVQQVVETVPAAEPASVRTAALPAKAPVDSTLMAGPSAAVPLDVEAVLVMARERIAQGQYLAAHRELSKLYWNAPSERPKYMLLLEETAQKIFFSPQPHFIQPYTIQSGDRLESVAKQYKLSWQYLAALNGVSPNRIREGQNLKVIKGPFAAVVDLKDYALTIHLQGYYVKRYTVGIGKDGTSPIGRFPVLNKVENPQYTAPDGQVLAGDDPRNPLGERWIDLGNSYGIHGTIEPDSVGQATSQGCIRLRDADVLEVYNFLVNTSEVVIRP